MKAVWNWLLFILTANSPHWYVLPPPPVPPAPLPPKPRVRVKAGSEPTNPLDGARLWGGS